MKILLAVCSLGAALYLGSQYEQQRAAKAAPESHATEASTELADGNARLGANEQATAQPTPKANWLEERNRNWQSPLSRGAYDRQHAVTIAPAPVVIVAPPIARPPLGFNRPPASNTPPGSRVPPVPPGVRRPLPPPTPVVRIPPSGPPLPRTQSAPPLPPPPTGN